MVAIRKDAGLTLSVLAALMVMPGVAVFGDGPAATGPASAPALGTLGGGNGMSAVVTTAPAPTVIVAPVPGATTAPAPEAAAVTQPFVGTVTADKVYVRSGPGTAYYEVGQLGRGDLVQVVGSRLGWYQILPPNGTFCLVAKEFVETDAAATTGTAKADYLNVRAGTAVSPNRDPNAVLTIIRKGTKLTIIGSTDKYYKVAPPEHALVYVSEQFIGRAPAGTEYKIPELRLPAGVAGPGVRTVTSTTLPSSTVELTPATGGTSGAAQVTGTVEPPARTGETATPQKTVSVAPVPAVTYDPTAGQRFAELNTRTQLELRKALGQRDLDGLIKEYQALLAVPNLPPSVQTSSESRVAALEKMATLQKLAKEGTASAEMIEEQRKALQQQYEQATKALEDYEKSGPYIAEGVLQTSTAVAGKYALVNPATKRVVAYVDPVSEVDISKLIGQYIGVRGGTHKAAGTEILVIHVKNATLLPAPALPTGSGSGK